jgi:hypothetical protein
LVVIAFVRLQFYERLMTEQPTNPTPTRVPDWLLPLGLYVVLSICIVIPFFFYGTASGHDFEFHAASWFDVASQWKQGILYPRWTAFTNHGFGEPRFIFYPPLSWMIGAALTLVLPDVAVPIVFIILIQTFAGLSAYFLLRNLASRRAAILGAACYLFNPNALLMSYIRSDYAEQLGCAFFPLLLLAALRLSGLLDDPHGKKSSIVVFAIPFACAWLSNAPAGVIASYSMALLFASAAFSQRSWQPLLRGIAGLALGLGFTAFYLLPAAYEQRWVNIGQALSSGLFPSQNFLFTETNDPEHTWFNWIASICAIALILILGLAALASRQFAANSAYRGNRKVSVALLVLGAAATLITLRVTLPLWTYLPKLRFVQFPWRWMSILALIAACFLAFAIESRRGWLWFAILLVLSIPLAHFQVQNTWWDGDEMPTMRDAMENGSGFDGTDEYDPLGDDHLDLPQNAPQAKILPADTPEPSTPAPQARVQIQRWTTKKKIILVDSPAEARLALRVLNYPAFRVTVNGKQMSPERMDDVNQMVVPIHAGSSTITVEFIRTKDRMLGDAISAASVLFAAFLFWTGRKREA